MRLITTSLVLLALLGACTQGEAPPDDLFAGADGGTFGADGTYYDANGNPVATSSLAYFNQAIGDRVFFAVDQSTLTPEATSILDKQASWLKQYSTGTITIEGHADEQGTREYNIALSARRAAAVRNYLVSQGIPDARLSTVPFGKERPVATCSDESCLSQNRRAVTVAAAGAGV
jgi:peptidoglycan-associated lipoprotein